MALPCDFHFLLLEGFTQLAFSCAIEPLRLANRVGGARPYAWRIVSLDGREVRSSCGTAVRVEGPLDLPPPGACLVVVGSLPGPLAGPDLAAQLREAQARGVQLIGLCGGVEVLAEAGLLDGETCAVPWPLVQGFARRFPKVEASDRAFTLGRIPTAATGVAASGLALQLIQAHAGAEIANRAAELMALRVPSRPETRQQVSLAARIGRRSPVLTEAVRLMERNLATALPLRAIATEIGVSPRQLERLFASHLNASPIRFYTQLRLERARRLLLETDLSVPDVSDSCGFRRAAHFIRIYRRHFGTAPGRARMVEAALGSGLIEFQSQKMTVAARAMADRKTLGHLS